MLPVEMLATSARPLADVLIDRLRAAGGPSALEQLRPHVGDEADALFVQADLPLEDEEDFVLPVRPLRPDEVVAAILLGRALDRNRPALRLLQDPATIAIVEVSREDLVEPVERIFRHFVVGGDLHVIDGDRCKPGDEIAPAGSVIVFSSDDESSNKALAKGNAAFGAAVQRRAAILGIAADPVRMLPSDLVRLAGHRIVLPPLDAEAVAAVIAAITGSKPAVNEELARATTVGALMACVRADLGAEASLARLRRLIARDPNASSEPSLADLHGLGPARAWGEALVADLRDYKAGRLPASALDRGALITGAPGVGKTMWARILAKEAGVHFIATSYSDWQGRDGSLGDVLKSIATVFADARRNRPCILFIDEIDSLPPRSGSDRNSLFFRACLNGLLAEFTAKDSDGLVVLAASNFPASALDPALVRSGRLDRHIEIPLPDVPALIGIFRLHLGVDLAAVDLRPAALAARGRTGADVERFVREARRAARKGARAMVLQDLLDAAGNNEASLSPDARRRIAYHEAGHAVVTLSLGLAQPVAISIEGGGGSAENEITSSQALTRGHCLDLLTLLLAGRAAEILAFGEPTAGAGGADGSDLDRATQLTVRLETSYGLGQLGPVAVTAFTARDLMIMPDLRNTVRRTLEAAEAQALELLTANRRSLDSLAEVLFQNGYLDRAEIGAVLASAPLGRKSPVAEVAPAPAPDLQSDHLGYAEEAGNGPRQAQPGAVGSTT